MHTHTWIRFYYLAAFVFGEKHVRRHGFFWPFKCSHTTFLLCTCWWPCFAFFLFTQSRVHLQNKSTYRHCVLQTNWLFHLHTAFSSGVACFHRSASKELSCPNPRSESHTSITGSLFTHRYYIIHAWVFCFHSSSFVFCEKRVCRRTSFHSRRAHNACTSSEMSCGGGIIINGNRKVFFKHCDPNNLLTYGRCNIQPVLGACPGRA
jgi:hypothetical protein